MGDSPHGWVPRAALYRLIVNEPPKSEIAIQQMGGRWRVTCKNGDASKKAELLLNGQPLLSTQVNIVNYQYSPTDGEQYILAPPVPEGVFQCVVSPGEGDLSTCL